MPKSEATRKPSRPGKARAHRSAALAALHETMAGLHDAGVIDKKIMRRFDKACLTPVPEYTPAQIRAIRERQSVSQPVFAAYLHVSKSTVVQWEAGDKKPRGASLKLLNIVDRKGLEAIA